LHLENSLAPLTNSNLGFSATEIGDSGFFERVIGRGYLRLSVRRRTNSGDT